ncbi:MAG: ribonuclease P protein component [Gammaproteobacteria bacterium]
MPGYGFPRKLRLLDASQFKAVFGNASYKVSNRYFLILARDNQLEHGRVGLVIGKKHLPKAVQRNRIKRLLRTSFRLNQDLLRGLDIVILARSNMNPLENRQIDEIIQQLWLDLIKKSKANPQNRRD